MIGPPDYCDLNRKFAPLEPGTKDQAVASYESDIASFSWYSKDWKKLHERGAQIVVVLGEPGSGRSYEFKAQRDKLSASGQPAFYLELHRLVKMGVDDLLVGSSDEIAYRDWKGSDGEACFFLDAVDEAKLDKALDFEAALENFRRSLGLRLNRAKIFISSRISAWQPEGDKALVEAKLSASSPQAKGAEGSGPSTKSAAVEVYVICPLSKDAVISLCVASGLDVPDAFLTAVDESHAWEFARRPLDVSFLIRYWKQSGAIGELTELLEASVQEMLKERGEKPDHMRAYPLSVANARAGAESMAAASVFCRTLDFVVAGSVGGGGRALSPLECLPEDWTPNQCSALIDRPLFDSAIYGTFRFHHRRIAEYLAACWLKRRMDHHCPPPVLRDFLFSYDAERLTLRPSVGSVATWLACLGDEGWTMDLRNWLLQSNPEVFLRYGDPSKLSPAFKHRILQAFADRFRDRGFLNIETDRFALSRLADAAMGESLAGMIGDSSLGDGPRQKLMKCATESRCAACVPAALELLKEENHSRSLESEVIELIGAAGTIEEKTRLKDLALGNEAFAHTHLGWLARILFPDVLAVEELKVWLEGAPDVGRLSTQRYFVKSVLKKAPEGWDPIEVLAMLCELNEPSLHCASTGRNPNYRGAWTKELIFPVLRHVLEGGRISEQDAEVIGTACAIVSLPSSWRDDYDSDSDEDVPDLDSLTVSHPSVRRVVFWQALAADHREEKNPRASFSGFWAFSHVLGLKLRDEDRCWLLEDIMDRESDFDKEVVAWLLLDLWQSQGRPWVQGWILLSDIERSGLRRADYLKWMIRAKAHWPPQWYGSLKRKGFLSNWYWRQRRGRVRRQWNRLRILWNLHRRLSKLRSGEYCSWLVDLCHGADDSMRWAVKDWSGLNKKFGPAVTRAVQQGCIRTWEQYVPEVKAEGGTAHGTIIGLSGLQLLYQDGRLNVEKLSSQDAFRAARYAVNEMNGHGEWLVKLADTHPAEVRTVLVECVEAEWDAPKRDTFWCRHLELLADKETTYTHLVCDAVMELFLNRGPGNATAISVAFKLLTTHAHGRCHSTIFADRAAEALTELEPKEDAFLPWLAILIQVDAVQGMSHLNKALGGAQSSTPIDPHSNIVVKLVVMLLGRRDSFPMITEPDYLKLHNIERFIRLVYRYVHPHDDVLRPTGESFTPVARDDAQSFRGSLLSKLPDHPGSEAELVLRSLLEDPDFPEDKDWLKHLIDKCVGRRADVQALAPSDLRVFVAKNEAPPRSAQELFALTLRRLASIKHDVEDADHSLRDDVRVEDREVRFRRFVARELNRRKNGLYTCTEESVIREEERLDIRVENPKCEGHVVIEAKIGNLNRSVDSLISDLESQLCERYLRDQNARYGVYLIACTETKTWRNPAGGRNLNLEEVIDRLKTRAKEIQASASGIESLEVVGIDFRAR